MKLIKPNFEIITQNPNNDGMLKHIELCGRVAWKSEERITNNSHIKFVDMLKGLNHCYVEGTELLTKQGWVKFDNYNKEEVAVVNLDGTLKGFECPINFIKDSFSGNFYKYETLGLEVTDGHKMFGMLANKDTDRYKNFSGELFECNKEYFDANKRKKTYGERWFKTLSVVKSHSYLLPMYQLIGFWLGDGCINDNKNVLTFHLRKERKVKYLESICKSLNFNYKYEKEHFRIYKKDINKYFITNFTKGKIKYIDENIINDSEIFSIIDGLINSDGNIGKTCTRISNKSDYIIKFLLNKGCLCGYNVIESSKISNDVRNVLILRTNTRIVNDSRKPLSKVKIENKTKNVYCITVSTGLIIVRGSNGVTTICGNCSVLEHGTVYLKVNVNQRDTYFKYCGNKYSKTNSIGEVETTVNDYKGLRENPNLEWFGFITTNYRVLVENKWLDDLQYQCEPTEFHEKRTSVRFICDRGVTHEFVRHKNILCVA